MTKISGLPIPVLRDPTFFQVAVVQNQWYDIWNDATIAAGAGSIKKNLEVGAIMIDMATGNEDLELRIIADDVDETISWSAVAGTDYYIGINAVPTQTTMLTVGTTAADMQRRTILLKAHKVQLMIRKTTATGANNLTVKVLRSDW